MRYDDLPSYTCPNCERDISKYENRPCYECDQALTDEAQKEKVFKIQFFDDLADDIYTPLCEDCLLHEEEDAEARGIPVETHNLGETDEDCYICVRYFRRKSRTTPPEGTPHLFTQPEDYYNL